MELLYRPRRMRRNPVIRELAHETDVNVKRLIQPYFVTDGTGVR